MEATRGTTSEGELILFTVTFGANPANDLTCPPLMYSNFNNENTRGTTSAARVTHRPLFPRR